MANLINKIITRILPAKRCPACRRTKEQAIAEQVDRQEECPLEYCAFKEEIRQAILESKTPEVILWNVDKTQILESENITLSWEVLYAKRITISGLGEIPLKDNRTFSPRRSTKYILTIQDYKDNIYEAEHPISVIVTPLPVIEIREENIKIERGNIAILFWNASNISKCILTIDNQMIDVTNLTEFALQPNEHTTYKLIFTALDNRTTVEKEIKIEVFPKPEIKHFEVSPEVVISSIPVTISWKVENAKKIEINNGVGEVNEEGHKTILHDKSTLYQLTAWGELSSVTNEKVVTVFPTPIIESLKIPMPDFSSSFSLGSIILNPPNINLSINIPDFNFNPPQYIKPDVPLNRIKPEFKPKMTIFNFSKLYESIKSRIKY